MSSYNGFLVFKASKHPFVSRRAGNASNEHEKGPAMGAIGVRELRRSVRFLRWALPVQRVNIRGLCPPIPPVRHD